MPTKFRLHRIVDVTGPGLLLQESLYGFIMALIFVTAAQLGLITYNSTSQVVTLIIGMNFTWGLIDMVIFFLVDSYDQKKYISIIKNKDLAENAARSQVHSNLSGTIADVLDDEDENRVVDTIMRSRLEPEEEIKSDHRGMLLSAFMCFVVTMLTVIPVIVPLLLIQDETTALFWASGFAATSLFFIGYYLAPYLGGNRWVSGIGLTIFAWAVTILATFTGG
jgi:hypothetical protein